MLVEAPAGRDVGPPAAAVVLFDDDVRVAGDEVAELDERLADDRGADEEELADEDAELDAELVADDGADDVWDRVGACVVLA